MPFVFKKIMIEYFEVVHAVKINGKNLSTIFDCFFIFYPENKPNFANFKQQKWK